MEVALRRGGGAVAGEVRGRDCEERCEAEEVGLEPGGGGGRGVRAEQEPHTITVHLKDSFGQEEAWAQAPCGKAAD